jgi:hypothetical protein
VWGNEETSFVPRVLEYLGGLNADRALAISSSHMYGLELILGVPEIGGEVPHLVDVGLLTWAKFPKYVPLEYPL